MFYVVVCQKANYIGESNKLINDAGYSKVTFRVIGSVIFLFVIQSQLLGVVEPLIIIYCTLQVPFISNILNYIFGYCRAIDICRNSRTICGNVALSYKPWNDAYNEFGVGGLIVGTFSHWGKFGKFVAVLLYISLICNNIMNTYSVAFEFQLVDLRLTYVPRWIWATIVTIIYLVLSVCGRNHFLTILSNFYPC